MRLKKRQKRLVAKFHTRHGSNSLDRRIASLLPTMLNRTRLRGLRASNSTVAKPSATIRNRCLGNCMTRAMFVTLSALALAACGTYDPAANQPYRHAENLVQACANMLYYAGLHDAFPETNLKAALWYEAHCQGK
jgi:hypothetical protein